MKKDDFDETILDDEEEFNKRFKRIERPAFLDKILKNKEAKNRITIYLDADIVEHFKNEAENSKIGYQSLINQTLREKITGTQTNKTDDELIETARRRARSEHTTLNEQFRRWLEEYAQPEQRLQRYDAVMAELRAKVRVGRKLTREEMNER